MGPLHRFIEPANGRSLWGYLALALALGLAGCGAAYLLTPWFRRNPDLVAILRRFGASAG